MFEYLPVETTCRRIDEESENSEGGRDKKKTAKAQSREKAQKPNTESENSSDAAQAEKDRQTDNKSSADTENIKAESTDEEQPVSAEKTEKETAEPIEPEIAYTARSAAEAPSVTNRRSGEMPLIFRTALFRLIAAAAAVLICLFIKSNDGRAWERLVREFDYYVHAETVADRAIKAAAEYVFRLFTSPPGG